MQGTIKNWEIEILETILECFVIRLEEITYYSSSTYLSLVKYQVNFIKLNFFRYGNTDFGTNFEYILI